MDDAISITNSGTTDCCFYAVLQVPCTASYDEIKQAYHREARLHHPDRKESCTEDSMFLRIQAAWDCLGDPVKRKAYDDKVRQQQDANKRRMRNATVLTLADCRMEESEAFHQCRCGFDMAVTSLPLLQDDLIACPGCSLIYDTAALFDDTPSP